MVRLQDDTTRGDGSILCALGALGLTIAFVALRRSTPRQGDQDIDKRKAVAPKRPSRGGWRRAR